MSADEADELLREVGLALHGGAVPYALVLRWEQYGAAAWEACESWLLLAALAVTSYGAPSPKLVWESTRAEALAEVRRLAPRAPTLAELVAAARRAA